jgi:hypothetical protein
LNRFADVSRIRQRLPIEFQYQFDICNLGKGGYWHDLLHLGFLSKGWIYPLPSGKIFYGMMLWELIPYDIPWG